MTGRGCDPIVASGELPEVPQSHPSLPWAYQEFNRALRGGPFRTPYFVLKLVVMLPLEFAKFIQELANPVLCGVFNEVDRSFRGPLFGSSLNVMEAEA